MNKYSFALDSFKNIQELIRFIDQKSSAVLVVYSFILTVFVGYTKELTFVNPFNFSFWKCSVSILTLLIGLGILFLLLYKIYVLVNNVLRPRLANNYKDDEYSLYYFEHISKMLKEDYIRHYDTLEEQRMISEISGQVYEVSHILMKKTKNLNKVMRHIFHSILLLLLFIFFSQLL